jgi:serine protease Do
MKRQKYTVFRQIFIISALLAGSAYAQELPRALPQSQPQVQLSFAPVVKQAAPAVVNIYTKRRVQVENPLSPLMQDPFFRQFFGGRLGMAGRPRERVVSSLGSGVIVEAGGTVVTSNHVIEGSEDIIAVLSDGREFNAKVKLADKSADLAVLTLDTKGATLPALPIVNSDSLQVGDLVLAIGNPFGVGQTVTSGIVSALARSAAGVSDYQFFIQTDAAINPGNSGGALVDMQGRLVGINTAIYSQSGGSIGVGFAIPSNMVTAVLRNGASGGYVVRPWLGGSYKNVDTEIAKAVGLSRARGVLVTEVVEGSPAAEAGLLPGDVIARFGDSDVDNADALKFRVATAELNREVPLAIVRGGETKVLTLTLKAPPEVPARDTRVLKGTHPLNGVTVMNLSPRVAADFNLALEGKGVVVSAVPPGFSLQPGDVLLSVNNTKVESTQQLGRLKQMRARGWAITFQRGEDVLQLQVQY